METRGEKLAEHLAEARRALEVAQERGLDRGIEVNGERVARLTERLDRLRGQWRELRAQEGRLRNEMIVMGADPETVPKRIVREVAAAQPAWRTHPATERQLRTIERLAAETNVPFVLEDGITKGQAHDLIEAMLAGNLPNIQFTGRPAGPMFIPAAKPRPQTEPQSQAEAEPSAADTGASGTGASPRSDHGPDLW